MVEEILQRSFLNDLLHEQGSKLEFNFPEIYRSRRGIIDVSEYKRLFKKQVSGGKRKQTKKE